ncbi:hypothetical protein B0J18DRAFT_414812 [Chaetomium sp. MPI-SDFR-AT-0129]|nr:hypothetical protein B0J18DRAFT_414812 [Chaetomium sp. MPI-SDFR-AT-0129]
MNLAASFGVIVALLGLATAQTSFPECTTDLLRTDDCAAVVNPTACYNQFRWSARTLGCIDGVDDTQRKARACACCACVGKVMCDWVTQNKFCS